MKRSFLALLPLAALTLSLFGHAAPPAGQTPPGCHSR